MAKKPIYVCIKGQGVYEKFRAASHEVIGLAAGTYHKFILEDGTEVWFNDFGLRTVAIADSMAKLN